MNVCMCVINVQKKISGISKFLHLAEVKLFEKTQCQYHFTYFINNFVWFYCCARFRSMDSLTDSNLQDVLTEESLISEADLLSIEIKDIDDMKRVYGLRDSVPKPEVINT